MLSFIVPSGHIIWNWLLLVLGVSAITYGASRMTDSAVSVARRLRVPKIIIGGTIVSVLTTLPEFCVSFSAAIRGYADTAFGNAVGSVVCNTGFILGICAIAGTVAVNRRIFLRQSTFMLAAGLIVAVLAWTQAITRWGAGILLAGFAVYVFWNLRVAGRERLAGGLEPQEKSAADTSLLKYVAFLVLGGILVSAGAVLLVDNAVVIAKWLGIPELIIALTLVAVGTSLPELATAVASFVKGHGDLSLGNIIGANVLDIFWVLGSAGMVREIKIQQQSLTLDMPFMLGLMLLLVLAGSYGKRIGRGAGIALFAVYVAYLVLMFTFFAK